MIDLILISLECYKKLLLCTASFVRGVDDSMF